MSDSKQKQTKIDTKFERPTETDSKETHTHTNKDTDTQTHTQTHTHTRYTDRHHTHTHTQSEHKEEDTYTRTHTQAISPQFLTLDHHFVRKGCAQTCEITILLARLDIKTYESERSAANAMLSCTKYHCTPVFDDRTSFRAKGLRRTRENRSFTSDFCDRTSFPAKGLSRHTQKRNFTSVFAIGPRFVRKGCRGTLKIATSPQFLAIGARFVRTGCVSYRLVGTAGISKASSRLRGTSRKRYSQAFARHAKELLMRATPPLPKPLPAHRRRSFRE